MMVTVHLKRSWLLMLLIAMPAAYSLGAQQPLTSPQAGQTPPLTSSGETHEEKLKDAAAGTLAKCPMADDAGYGRSMEKTIKVGGGDFKGPAREIAFLHALRGPSGQGITFKRIGATMNANLDSIDIYEITYDGLKEPDHLYIDEYTWETPRLPVGYTCSEQIPLKAPVEIKP